MAVRRNQSSELTTTQGGDLDETRAVGITVKRKQQETPPNELQAQAVAIEEINQSFKDPDLTAAILLRLARMSGEIKELATQEEQLAKAQEIARYEALDQARERGVQEGRAEIARREQAKLKQSQTIFINSQLPDLINSLNHLEESALKKVVEAQANRFNVQIVWEISEGELRCVAKPRS